MRHSQEAIGKLVKEQQSSGKTVREFCAARGLNPEVFYVWRQRARKGSGGFARVEATGELTDWCRSDSGDRSRGAPDRDGSFSHPDEEKC